MPFLSFVNTILKTGKKVNDLTFEENQKLLNQFLTGTVNTTVRVYVGASSGFGHQANTINIIKRLSALGFNQSMQVIYDDVTQTEPTTIQKLARLIPGLNPEKPDPVTFYGINLSFISTTNFGKVEQPVVNFGFTGGYDDDKDLSKITLTKIFLKLQPYDWNQPEILYLNNDTGEQTKIDLTTVDVLGGGSFKKRNYYFPFPAMTEDDYAAFSIAAPTKVDPYKKILAACSGDNPAANMMPVYGIGDLFTVVEAMPNTMPESILFNLIASIAYAQDKSTIAKLKKGAIIVVISTVSQKPCYDNLNKALTGTLVKEAFLNTYATTNLAGRVNVISFDAENFNTLLEDVQQAPNKILVIKMNGLPGTPFNYLYYKSTLPSMFEGKGTASLALNLPVPFYFLNENKPVYPTLPLNSETADPVATTCHQKVMRLNEGFAKTNIIIKDRNADATAMVDLGIFLSTVSQTGTDEQKYFSSLSDFFHQEKEDKLVKALHYMLQTITD